MLPADIIARKRDGQSLSAAEIGEFIDRFTRGTISEAQMAALAMAICCRGMNSAETFALTQALLASGTTLPRTVGGPPRVDKHSTGGIGDKVSLILAPLLACCGLEVPMIAGRGLGPTGGTLDKLEAIPGFRTQLTADDILRMTRQVGCVIAGATEGLVPADRKLYALRDVTGTVHSAPLITASIMSKKLAESLDALVLDVKHGSGALIKETDQALELARAMIAVGEAFGVRTTALLTDMNQPLGRMIGNAVEVEEALAALEGGGPPDLLEVTLALGAELLVATGRAEDLNLGRQLLRYQLDSGAGREKFARMVAAQGGDLARPRDVAPCQPLLAESAGYVCHIDCQALGLAVIELGGGRRQPGDRLDYSVGLEMLVRLGDRVSPGEPLLHVFAQPAAHEQITQRLRAAITLGPEPLEPPPLILPVNVLA